MVRFFPSNKNSTFQPMIPWTVANQLKIPLKLGHHVFSNSEHVVLGGLIRRFLSLHLGPWSHAVLTWIVVEKIVILHL